MVCEDTSNELRELAKSLEGTPDGNNLSSVLNSYADFLDGADNIHGEETSLSDVAAAMRTAADNLETFDPQGGA